MTMPHRYWGRATILTPAYRARVDCGRHAVSRPDREHDRSCPKSWHAGRDWYWQVWDMSAAAENVRLSGKTGSDRHTFKAALLTRRRHRRPQIGPSASREADGALETFGEVCHRMRR